MAYSGSNTIHATFNWNPAYDAYKHVALWGNDATGDGTKKKPYRTIAKACSLTGANIVIGAGVYRETITATTTTLNFYADGNVVIDLTATSSTQMFTNVVNVVFNNIYFKGLGANNIVQSSSGVTAIGCTFDGIDLNLQSAGSYSSVGALTNCTFTNITSLVDHNLGNINYCTFYNCTQWQAGAYTAANALVSKCIFKDMKVNLPATSQVSINYCNFHNCLIKFATTGTYVSYTTQAAFIAAFVAAGGNANNVQNIYFVDPQFVNVGTGDLTLNTASPAKNMASDGTQIGSQLIATGFVANTNAATSAFDNSSAVNMTIDPTTGALTMTSTSAISQIVSKPIPNLAGRNLNVLNIRGFYADRNGQYIDATTDLDSTGLYSAGDSLTTDRIYIVDISGGQIIYNGTTFAVGDRFTCVSAASVFTNVSVAGFVREIIESPTRNNVEARFSNGTGSFKNNGDTLTAGYWYYLSTGSATLNSVAYAAGQYIKGDGTNVSLAGTLEEIFTTDAYQFYETFGAFTCNRTGNVFTGSITKGNGDPSFDRTTANVFKIASKHLQYRFTIQYNNLTP